MPLRMRVNDKEPIGLALRRFKKSCQCSGIFKELRNAHYEKPCELRRRAELQPLRHSQGPHDDRHGLRLPGSS